MAQQFRGGEKYLVDDVLRAVSGEVLNLQRDHMLIIAPDQFGLVHCALTAQTAKTTHQSVIGKWRQKTLSFL